MTTERLFAAQLGHPHTTPIYGTRHRPCVYRLLGVPGTAREWAEDLGAVVAGLALVAEIATLLWMVAGR